MSSVILHNGTVPVSNGRALSNNAFVADVNDITGETDKTPSEVASSLSDINSALGAAITAKGGTVASGSTLSDKAEEVGSIPSGGGGGTPEHGVFFIDYDGSIVASWGADEVASKTALPNNPTHTGLVAQGWNWSLSTIKSYISKYPNTDVWIGQMYKTESGLTEIDITVTKKTELTVTCKMSGNKDWGDGTADSSTSHTYQDYGSYTITCNGTSIPSGSASSGGMFGSSSSNMNRYWCTAIRIGTAVTSIGNYAFQNCYSLTSITIPESVTTIGSYAFTNCYSLTNVTIPEGVTTILTYTFQSCYSLASITIPESVTTIGSYTFNNCYSLASVTIPEDVTTISSYTFYNCYSLASITIPEDVTTIDNSAFRNCYSLTSITVPEGVTTIATYAFNICHSLIGYDFSAVKAVASLGNTNAFTGINGVCKIIVPDTLYDSWIIATNWSTYADYIYKVSEVV